MQLARLATASLLLALACAPPSGYASGGIQRDRARITEEEISASLATDAYDAITKLRANFLASRGPPSLRLADSRLPTVFVDGLEYGTIATLKQIPASDISEIRLLRGWEATTIYGTGYVTGVIAITTRRQ